MNRKKRLLQQKTELEQRWENISETLEALHQSAIVENRVDEKLRLKRLIGEAEAKRDEYGQKLDRIEARLALLPAEGSQARPKARIFISYKRDTEPDELVALQIYDSLSQEHEVFVDQSMRVGEPWAERIKRELGQADFLITFLSARSVGSEMVKAELEMAHELAAEQAGWPIILPVRLAYRDPFQYPLNVYLDSINWAFWRTQADTPRIIQELQLAISGDTLPVNARLKPHIIRTPAPQPLPEPTAAAQPLRLEQPEGTMRPRSPFYIERQEDRIALEAIKEHGVTITIKAPRQMGKSSLLMRIIEAALTGDKRVAFLDFQLFDAEALADPDIFFRRFCIWLTQELKLPNRVADYWQQPLGNTQRCALYVGDYLLPRLEAQPLLLAMDEVDRVFESPFRSDFFGMLRNWHNRRVHPTDRTWQQLDLALVTSTEPYQLIENLNQSPFNVGEVIDLPDFAAEQVAELNRRHNSPLKPARLGQLMVLLGGHPYLTRRALYLVASGRLPDSNLFDLATADRGPFGDHLRHHAFRLHGRPALIEGLRQVIDENSCPDERVFFRLRGAGLVRRPADGQQVYPRCQLYADFFRERLNG